jgi:hypothetical protein
MYPIRIRSAGNDRIEDIGAWAYEIRAWDAHVWSPSDGNEISRTYPCSRLSSAFVRQVGGLDPFGLVHHVIEHFCAILQYFTIDLYGVCIWISLFSQCSYLSIYLYQASDNIFLGLASGTHATSRQDFL